MGIWIQGGSYRVENLTSRDFKAGLDGGAMDIRLTNLTVAENAGDGVKISTVSSLVSLYNTIAFLNGTDTNINGTIAGSASMATNIARTLGRSWTLQMRTNGQPPNLPAASRASAAYPRASSSNLARVGRPLSGSQPRRV